MSHPRRSLLSWIKLLAFTTILVVAAVWILSIAALVTTVTIPLQHPICWETPAGFGADYENVSFTTVDGLTLRGWYISPQNGVVIILVHPYYGDRTGTIPLARMLYKHGYGLLMYDQRASGESDGTVRSLGWRDIPDVRAAADLVVTRQKDVKIGISGCSVGGAIAVAGAAQTPSITAVAVDAPSPLSWQEYQPSFSFRDPFGSLTIMLFYPLVSLRAGALPPNGTAEAVRAYSPRPILLISTGSGGEKGRIEGFYEAASDPKIHWNIPNSSHCAAPFTHPAEYEQHLVKFFDTYLLK